ncbi:MAG: UDP-N-acetylmuramoyl-tripeptide--D-alanyl-D-alanine ligase [Dysgonomonas sp.]
MEIAQLYDIFKLHPHISTDTRKTTKDSIFFALKGTNFNGNEYAKKALEQGCSYAVIDEEKYADGDERMLIVDDVLKALQNLANYHRSKFKIPIIAITGTNGKTTTKELVASVLAQEYNILFTEGNLNNHIGVPLTLLQIKKEHELAIIEMGASHLGEINALCEIADPNFGLITNVGYAHLEGFGSFENIIKTKGELYEYIRNKKDGKIFLDHDNPYLTKIAEGITSIEYGVEDDLFVAGSVVSNDPYLTFKWRFSRNPHIVHTHLIGEYNLSNALAAITIGKYFGVKSDLVCKAIEDYKPNNNRSQLTQTESNMLIVDAYNANPTSMQAALSNFDHMNVNQKVLILGDMRELGENSSAEHQKIVDYIKGHNFDKVFLVGENFGKTQSDYPKFKDVSELNSYLKEHPLKESYVLIKGSRGIALEKSLDLL